MELWECFTKDKVFKSYLPLFLKKVALLLTLDDRLFSTCSGLLPMYLPNEACSLKYNNVFKIMTQLKLPFLDTSIVTIAVECPRLSDHERI